MPSSKVRRKRKSTCNQWQNYETVSFLFPSSRNSFSFDKPCRNSQVLASKRYTEISLINAVCKTGQRRQETDDQSKDRTPVCGEFGGVAVDTVELVHFGHGNVAATDNVVAVTWSICCMLFADARSTHSVMMMAVIGPRKMVYPLKKERNF